MALRSLKAKLNTLSLSHKLFDADTVRRCEPLAAEAAKCSMYELMERAGKAGFDFLLNNNLVSKNVLIITGSGNNGGDGYVIARLLIENNYAVTLVSLYPQKELQGDAQTAKLKWLGSGGQIAAIDNVNFDNYDVIVDAILGTGLNGEVKDDCAEAIEKINLSNSFVLSLDIPSGLASDSGQILGKAVNADATITFVGIKSGLTTGIGKHQVGKLVFATLGIAKEFESQATPVATVVSHSDFESLEKRQTHSHKGHFGRLVCVGGNQGMSGAIRLSAEAAMRTGAGLVRVFCHQRSVLQVSNGRPELMVTDENLLQHLDWADCILIGPGLGQDSWSRQTFAQVLSYLAHEDKPVVFDADALNLLSRHLHKFTLSNMLITPHPAEAARLLGTTVTDIENNRYNSAFKLNKTYHSVSILKGAGSIIQDNNAAFVCADGNPGMATAGMGDALTGIIAALLSQGMSSKEAGVYGTCLHGAAADLNTEKHGQRGMLASDIFEQLRQLVN